ncbi:MAG: CehA/McbA family metallohydrolase [Planctomycetota bacterium]
MWTTWTRAHEGAEGIWLRSFTTRNAVWQEIIPVSEPHPSEPAAALTSETTLLAGRLLIVWSAFSAGGWTLQARSFDLSTQQFGQIHLLAGSPGSGEIHLSPALASGRDRALVVWQAETAGRQDFRILGRVLRPDGEPIGGAMELAAQDGHDCCRPAVAAAPDGPGFAVAFDRLDAPGTQNVYLVICDGRSGKPDNVDPIPVTRHPAGDLAPDVAYSPDGELLWVAWHSNRRGDDGWDIPRWYRLAALNIRDRTWHQPAGAKTAPKLEPRGTVQGFELVRTAVSPDGVVCILGRASHSFYIQYYTAAGRSPMYRLPSDGWGGRGRLLRGVFDAEGALWVTRRDLLANVLHRIDGFSGLAGPPQLDSLGEPTRTSIGPLSGVTPRYEWPEPPGNTHGFQVYFGDIHGHSWQSDGMGLPEESYLRARDVFRDDFHALTDHDRFVGKRVLDGQWQEQKGIAEHYHAPGTFVTFFGQEWTTPRTNRPHGWGHFNIYSADPSIPLLDHGDPRFRDLPDLYAALRPHDAIAVPHHIGWTGVPWDALDAGLTPVVEICSVHGAFEYEGNEPIRHRDGMKGCFVRDGLGRGLRFGFVGASDQHGLIWHHGICWKRNVYRAGLTGIWSAGLTRAALLDALRARRTFATTGVKVRLYFAVNDALMGSVIDTDRPPTLRIDVAVAPEESRLAWIEIVRDGAVIHHYGGEGRRSRYTFADEQCPSGTTCYYYLRVTLADDNMAWSSPVWVGRT